MISPTRRPNIPLMLLGAGLLGLLPTSALAQDAPREQREVARSQADRQDDRQDLARIDALAERWHAAQREGDAARSAAVRGEIRRWLDEALVEAERSVQGAEREQAQSGREARRSGREGARDSRRGNFRRAADSARDTRDDRRDLRDDRSDAAAARAALDQLRGLSERSRTLEDAFAAGSERRRHTDAYAQVLSELRAHARQELERAREEVVEDRQERREDRGEAREQRRRRRR